MYWIVDQVTAAHRSAATFDGGRYAAVVYYDYQPTEWTARIEVTVGRQKYVATNESRALDTYLMAQMWCEAALLQLQRIAAQLGDARRDEESA